MLPFSNNKMFFPLVDGSSWYLWNDWVNSRFCIVSRIYTITNSLSFIEYLVEPANHKGQGASPLLVIKLCSGFNALRVNSKSFVLFIEQEMRIEVILVLTDCGMSLGLLWLVFLRSIVWPLANRCLSWNSKSMINNKYDNVENSTENLLPELSEPFLRNLLLPGNKHIKAHKGFKMQSGLGKRFIWH